MSGTARLYGLDWIRATGPAELEDVVIRWAVNRFGADFEDQHGFMFYGHQRKWASGVQVLTEHRGGDSVMVQLTGDALELLTVQDRLQVVRELNALGLKFTRIDVAIDRRGRSVGLIDAVLGACYRGELCAARTFKPFIEYGTHGQVVGYAAYLGRRGSDGSGRFVRVYDKGLETGECAMGRWERWEAEFTGDVAAQVGQALAIADKWEEVAAAMCIGAVDFRIGEHRRALAERPRAPWWSAVLRGTEGIRCTKARRLSSLRGRVGWLRSQVGLCLVGMARASNRTVREVFSDVVRDLRFGVDVIERASRTMPAVQYAEFCKRPAAFRSRRSFRMTV